MMREMFCIHCDSEMIRGPVSITGTYHGQAITVEMPDGFSCKCGFVTVSGKYSEEFGVKVREQAAS